ncbi:hypothetical protein HPB51_015033 [Rhipicephalus microplus]|uniref:Uncharacterized protein n=1 Tax=Rhipicephalus microplus TaxID=6941 RepID=A0A9J6ETT2_RHIMP|nr:hypothetical protein HPB51_015033 [Rhipicephalus microplus]
MAGTDQTSGLLPMGLVLLCAIVLFAVLWTIMRKYCPAMPFDEKSVSSPGIEAPIDEVPRESLQQHQLNRTQGNATTIAQPTAESKTSDPTAEAGGEVPHSGTSFVERSAKASMSLTRRLTNAALKVSVAVSRAIKKETTNMLKALSSGAEVVHTRALACQKTTETEDPPSDQVRVGKPLADHTSGGRRGSSVQCLANAARNASTTAEAVACQESVEMEDLPSEKTPSDAAPSATAHDQSPQDGTSSPGRRFANAAGSVSVSASCAVKKHQTNMFEAPSTNDEVAQVPLREDSQSDAYPAVTKQGGEAQPPKSVASGTEEGVMATDAKSQTNPSIPREHRPAKAASLEVTFAEKPTVVQKVEAVNAEKAAEDKDKAKPSEQPTVAGVASPRHGPAATSSIGGTAEESPVSPPGGDSSSNKSANSADQTPADDSTLLSREQTSKMADAHRHRRNPKRRFLAGGRTTDDVIAQSDVHSSIGKPSAKGLDAADYKTNELESPTQRKS